MNVLWLMQAATEVRKEVNELDNLTTGKAVDVLLNYETVKLFNNEQLEVDQYDAYLLGFQVRIIIPFSPMSDVKCSCRNCMTQVQGPTRTLLAQKSCHFSF